MTDIGSIGAPAMMGNLWSQLAEHRGKAGLGGAPAPPGAAGATDPGAAGGSDRTIQALKQFEGVLLHRLIGAMRESIPDSSLIDDGASRQMQDLFWFQLTEQMTRQGGLGMWKQLAGQLAQAGVDLGEQPAGGSLELMR